MKLSAAWIKFSSANGLTNVTDLGLKALTVTIAAGSFIFATNAILVPRKPFIPGIEDLAIFAQPNLSAIKKALASLDQPAGQIAPARGVDYEATGAIPKTPEKLAKADPTPKADETETSEAPDDIEILKANPQFAWVRKRGDILLVRKGETVAGAGPILAIENKNGRWRLKFAKTYIPPLSPQQDAKSEPTDPLPATGARSRSNLPR